MKNDSILSEVVHRINKNPIKTTEIVKNSGFTPYLLSCKMRVSILNDPESKEMAEMFGMTIWEYSSYICARIEKIKLS